MQTSYIYHIYKTNKPINEGHSLEVPDDSRYYDIACTQVLLLNPKKDCDIMGLSSMTGVCSIITQPQRIPSKSWKLAVHGHVDSCWLSGHVSLPLCVHLYLSLVPTIMCTSLYLSLVCLMARSKEVHTDKQLSPTNHFITVLSYGKELGCLTKYSVRRGNLLEYYNWPASIKVLFIPIVFILRNRKTH